MTPPCLYKGNPDRVLHNAQYRFYKGATDEVEDFLLKWGRRTDCPHVPAITDMQRDELRRRNRAPIELRGKGPIEYVLTRDQYIRIARWIVKPKFRVQVPVDVQIHLKNAIDGRRTFANLAVDQKHDGFINVLKKVRGILEKNFEARPARKAYKPRTPKPPSPFRLPVSNQFSVLNSEDAMDDQASTTGSIFEEAADELGNARQGVMPPAAPIMGSPPGFSSVAESETLQSVQSDYLGADTLDTTTASLQDDGSTDEIPADLAPAEGKSAPVWRRNAQAVGGSAPARWRRSAWNPKGGAVASELLRDDQEARHDMTPTEMRSESRDEADNLSVPVWRSSARPLRDDDVAPRPSVAHWRRRSIRGGSRRGWRQ